MTVFLPFLLVLKSKNFCTEIAGHMYCLFQYKDLDNWVNLQYSIHAGTLHMYRFSHYRRYLDGKADKERGD